MHTSALLTLLLALGATETLGAHIRRHPKGEVERRGAASSESGLTARSGGPLSGGKKGKRLVRKKRGTQCVVHGNSTSSLVTTTATTTNIGNDNHANVPITTTTTTTPQAPTTTTTTTSQTPQSTSSWKLTDNWSGNTFFDHWNFWSWDDPTHGTVDYQDAGNAWNQGLIRINSKGQAIMDVDKTQHVSGRGRKSVRIHGNKVFTGGLVLMDAEHMPTGCGTWPAWWMNGPNWPYGGEIDILEGVNSFSQNQVSIHTGSGCRMPSNANDLQTGTLTTGGYDSYNCASYETANQGCGVRDLRNANTYGKPFNDIGGGVYAMLWAKVGIKVWWFPRYAIPADINNNQPDPSTWGLPVADFPSAQCNPYQFFYDHYNIFDTTFCGDWAGADGVWKYAGYAGQDQSCASITGYATCSDYVMNVGSAFNEAYWTINYVKYFNSTTEV